MPSSDIDLENKNMFIDKHGELTSVNRNIFYFEIVRYRVFRYMRSTFKGYIPHAKVNM